MGDLVAIISTQTTNIDLPSDRDDQRESTLSDPPNDSLNRVCLKYIVFLRANKLVFNFVAEQKQQHNSKTHL
jgi:hypothetical protein